MLHLLHPAFVHFSVALLLLGAPLEAWGLLRGRPKSERLGATLVLAGTLSLFPTIVSGFLAGNTVALPEGTLPLLETHERIGLLVLGIFLSLQFWKAWVAGRFSRAQRPVYAALLLAGAALVALGAFLGGQMVYGHGIGVLAR